MYSRDVERDKKKEKNILSYGTCGTFLGHCGRLQWHFIWHKTYRYKDVGLHVAAHICLHSTLCTVWEMFSLETRFSWIWMDWIHDFNLRSSFWKCQPASPILLGLAEGDTLDMVLTYESYLLTIESFTLSPIYGTKNWLKSECCQMKWESWQNLEKLHFNWSFSCWLQYWSRTWLPDPATIGRFALMYSTWLRLITQHLS